MLPDVRRNSVIVRHSAALLDYLFSITFTGTGLRQLVLVPPDISARGANAFTGTV